MAKHGLAVSIRSSTDSEMFDLGGLSASTIEQVLNDAMDEPFELSKMIRITFAVGAGKQSRQKYDPQAMRIVTSTLQKCGFNEDRGASCVMEASGTYKLQHDTGKNIKTVVVFPKVKAESPTFDSTDDDEEDILFFPKSSMEYKIAVSSLIIFQNILKAKCQTWSQKKALSQLIEKELVEKIINPVDDMLVRGKRIPKGLQYMYDNVVVEISEKQNRLKEAMHQQVNDGVLTQIEIDHLLEQVEYRIENAKHNSKAFKKATDRFKKLKTIDPTPHLALKYHSELGKLWKEANRISINDSRGGLLSVQDAKLLGKLRELEEEIERLEQASREWLEDDQTFDIRLQKCRSEFEIKFSRSKLAKRGGKESNTQTIRASIKTRPPITKWVTPADKKFQQMSKPRKKMTKGGVFGEMMADDSSDDNSGDSSDEEDDKKTRERTKEQITAQSFVKKSNQHVSLSMSKKKKNNKKKKAKSKIHDKVSIHGSKTTEIEAPDGDSATLSMLRLLLSVLTWFLPLIFRVKQKKI
jgi:predicted RNA-binding protein with PUA-like domain